MKLQNTHEDHLDLTFEIPQQGVSIVQVEEGIQKRTNEKSGKTTLQIPLVIDKVVEGPEENQGKKLSHFVPIEMEFGERQLAGILTLTGLIDSFAQKFGEDVDITGDQFINAVKIKLSGKVLKAHHEVKKDQSGKDRANVTKFEKVGSNAPTKGHTPAAAASGGNQSDW